MIPGAVGYLGAQDVGGSDSLGAINGQFSIHGGSNNDMRVMTEGFYTGGNRSGLQYGNNQPNVGSTEEVSIDVAGNTAERAEGGILINFVPKAGGNKYNGSLFVSGTGSGLSGSNLTERVKDLGFQTDAKVIPTLVSRHAIETRKSELAQYDLTPDQAGEDGLVCGGRMQVFIEPLVGTPTLLLFGAGHVAQPLARLAKSVGFRVEVADDRLKFANRERFPDADLILVEPVGEAAARMTIGRNSYAVVVTRGHKGDADALQDVLGKGLRFVGLLGSRPKAVHVMRELEERGGWRHWYAQPLAGGAAQPITQGAFDVRARLLVDTAGGWFYYVASPEKIVPATWLRNCWNGEWPLKCAWYTARSPRHCRTH